MRQNKTLEIMLSVCLLAGWPAGSLANPMPCSQQATPPTSQSLALALGTAVANTKWEDLSLEVRERTRLNVLDVVATLAYTTRLARHEPFVQRALLRRGNREAMVPGLSTMMPVEDAAATLAWLIHAAETDDTDHRASLRASPVVFAPALAMAQFQKKSGREFLASLAMGYTTLGRLAAPLGPMQPRGFMSSGVWGPPAGAALSANLLDADGVTTAHAIAIAGSASGGSFQYFFDQTEEKRLIVARAARAGVEAAILACQGEVGALRIFEGQAGLYPVLGRGSSVESALVQVTHEFHRLEGPLRLAPKYYAASASIIPALDGLALERQLRPFAIDQIATIELHGDAQAARIYKDKLDNYAAPLTDIGAKTNFAYTVALFLVVGSADAHAFSEARRSDPTINAIAGRMRFVEASGPATLVLHMKDNTKRIVTPKASDGSQDEPLRLPDRLAKFESLTRDVFTTSERAQVMELIDDLENETDMAAWVRRLDRLMR